MPSNSIPTPIIQAFLQEDSSDLFIEGVPSPNSTPVNNNDDTAFDVNAVDEIDVMNAGFIVVGAEGEEKMLLGDTDLMVHNVSSEREIPTLKPIPNVTVVADCNGEINVYLPALITQTQDIILIRRSTWTSVP